MKSNKINNKMNNNITNKQLMKKKISNKVESEWNIIFNEQQKKFIDAPLEDSKLIGGPGTGKTTMIIYKILNYLKNKTLQSKNDFLILLSNETMCNTFINMANNVKNGIFNNDNVRTLQSLANTMIQRLNKKGKTINISMMI